MHLLVMLLAAATIFSFTKAHNTAKQLVVGALNTSREKWMGNVAVQSIAMVVMLIMVFPAIIIFNKAGPDFQNAKAEEMAYAAWLGFSVFSAIYFLLVQPLVTKVLKRYVS